MTDKNIVLIGFMGTGKTSVGRVLARRLRRRWVDLDRRVETKEKKRIFEIFEQRGEVYFRKLEKDAVEEVARLKRTVITTGGGVVMDTENMDRLEHNGVVVLLEASPVTIYSRVSRSKHRPLLHGEDPMGHIIKLLEQRKPLYERCHHRVATDGLTSSQVASRIIRCLAGETANAKK